MSHVILNFKVFHPFSPKKKLIFSIWLQKHPKDLQKLNTSVFLLWYVSFPPQPSVNRSLSISVKVCCFRHRTAAAATRGSTSATRSKRCGRALRPNFASCSWIFGAGDSKTGRDMVPVQAVTSASCASCASYKAVQ